MLRPVQVSIDGFVGFPIESDSAAGTAVWVTVGHANKIGENVYILHFNLSAYGKAGYYKIYEGAFVPIEITGQAA